MAILTQQNQNLTNHNQALEKIDPHLAGFQLKHRNFLNKLGYVGLNTQAEYITNVALFAIIIIYSVAMLTCLLSNLFLESVDVGFGLSNFCATIQPSIVLKLLVLSLVVSWAFKEMKAL